MATSFTKGPWAVNGTRVEHETEHGWINDGWIICECYGPDDEANARLIAVAHDLLEALKGMVGVYAADCRPDSLANAAEIELTKMARAAIAKAYGGKL